MVWEIKSIQDISIIRWNTLVARCEQVPLYMNYVFLMACHEHWDVIIASDETTGDYLWAMALPYRTQHGIKYVYQPPYVPYLHPITILEEPHLLNHQWLTYLQVYRYIPKLFLRTDIDVPPDFTKFKNAGYQIALNQPYDHLQSGYSAYRKRRLRKAQRADLVVECSFDLDQFIDIHERFTLPKVTGFHNSQYPVLHNLWKQLMQHGLLELWTCRYQNEIVGGFLAGKFKKKIYYLASSSTVHGRKLNAMTLTLDTIINTYSSACYQLLDLGTAGFAGIDRFKQSFGATRYPIFQLYRNNLPWYIRVPKKVINTLGISLTTERTH